MRTAPDVQPTRTTVDDFVGIGPDGCFPIRRKGLELVDTGSGEMRCLPVSHFTRKALVINTCVMALMGAIAYGFFNVIPPARPFAHLIGLCVFAVPWGVFVLSWALFARSEDLGPRFVVTKTSIESLILPAPIALVDIRAVVSISGYVGTNDVVSVVQICVDRGTEEQPDIVTLAGTLQIMPAFTRRLGTQLAESIGCPYVDARVSKSRNVLGEFDAANARYEGLPQMPRNE